MEQKIEGLILKKNPWGERHIMSDILLRNGKKVTVTFYGGQGGGKKRKAGTIEVGQLMAVELQKKNRAGDVYSAKEWVSRWTHSRIRENHRAFYVTCSFLEIMGKITHSVDLKDQLAGSDQTDEGFFKVLSNALFHLEFSLEKGIECRPSTHIFYFLSKLLIELGVYPIRQECCLSGEKITEDTEVSLLTDQGGFAIAGLAGEGASIMESTLLWKYLGQIWSTPYKNLNFELEVPRDVAVLALDYFCYQLGINKSNFKSLGMVL